MCTEYYLKIRQKISDRKFVKAMLADIYASDIKMKNHLLMILDCGVAKKISEKNILSQLDIYQFEKIIEQQYGIESDDIKFAIIEWTHILDVEIEPKVDDEEKASAKDLLEYTKELFAGVSDTFLDKQELSKNIWEILSYAYILSSEEIRENIKKNCSEFFNINSDKVTSQLLDCLRNMNEYNFVEKKVNRTLSSTLKYIDEAIEKSNKAIINEKCFWSLKILKSIIISIVYRDGSVQISLFLIFITALFDANEQKLLLSGYKDRSSETILLTFPSFDEVVQHSAQCTDQTYYSVGISEIDQKCRNVFSEVKNSVMDKSIISIFEDLSNVKQDYIISKIKFDVHTEIL